MMETERQQRVRETQEMTIYRVQKDFGRGSDVYRVTKLVIGVPTDVYHVTHPHIGVNREPFCDCPGFIRQKFDKDRHKHVRIVRDYISRGEPTYADYRFIGAGKSTKIRFLEAK